MVAAMGPLGVEGPFRKSCAITLRVLRINTNTLMSIVAPFVYDPLVSWPRNISALPNVHNAERTNEEVNLLISTCYHLFFFSFWFLKNILFSFRLWITLKILS